MNNSKTSKRLFWSCTHVTLRRTEIPLFLEHNIEVVPEEVCATVMNPIEGRDYDNEALHPVIRQWKQKCTLNDDVLNVVRRARLMQRKGVISQAEQKIFNNYFDAIYIATDLDTAVEVSSWFEGEVIFRYFGFLDNLRSLKELTEKHSSERLKNLIFCPIFTSLLELKEAKLFKRSAVVHGYIDTQDRENTWSGWTKSQSASVVTHDLQSTSSERADVIRSIMPLARHINIDLLGKNFIDNVPQDIRASFDVVGILPFEDYLKKLLSSRLLIHPFGNRYHNHYTNIEAVVAGVPVLFLSENPLYNENSLSGTLSGPASEYGAFSDINELIEQTKHLFDQQDKLKKIAKRQKKLLAPFSKENVSAEIGELTALFNFSRRDEKMNVPATPFSEIPCSDFYQNHEIFAKGNASVPLTAYINNEQLPFVNVDSNGQVSVRISADDGLIQLTLPGRDLQFAAHKHHCIKLSGSASGFGQIVVVAEVWANNKMLVSNKSSLILVNAQSKKIDFPFDIDSAEDFSIALYIRIVGNLNVSLEMLSHKVGKRSGEKKSPLLYSPHNLSDSWNSGKKISAMLFAPEEEAYQGLINGERSFGVNISRDEYAVLRLDYNGQPLMCKTYSIELDFQSDSPCQVELCLESWSDKNQIVHRKTQTTSIDVGDNRIVIAAGSWDRQPIIPILFVKSPFAGKSVLKTIRKITPPKKANNPISFLFGKGASDTPAKPENETPSVKYQFYGQFNPPVDQFLFETYFKDRKEPGFFIECGAYDGRIDSSCLFFKETLGWKGANIEASRYLYRSLVVNRPGETNVFCALSDKAGTAVFRNAIHPELGRRFGNGSLNHTKEHIKELEDRNCEFEEYEVPTIPFRDLIEQYDIKQVDLFVLDVEGHELAVLKGMKGSSVLPSIICAEHGQLGVEALRGPMEELGYVYDAQSHVNSTWLLKSEQ